MDPKIEFSTQFLSWQQIIQVRVQSDPAGRLVISGEPENPMNPWGATPFKKVNARYVIFPLIHRMFNDIFKPPHWNCRW